MPEEKFKKLATKIINSTLIIAVGLLVTSCYMLFK